MTPLAEILRDEIAREGPISFRRFMEMALYQQPYGYYRRAPDPFGREGDFYTAEQLQPVFGILMAAVIRGLAPELSAAPDFTVVELGAGRAEMAQAFAAWRYVPVDIARGALPARFRGVVLCNEFFDALPVEVVSFLSGCLREMRVGWKERFAWQPAGAAREELAEYIRRYFPAPRDGAVYEVNLDALDWLRRIAGALEQGFLITIDYGYTRAEAARFPRGSLMSYRRHQSDEDVLRDPGSRDITAHVCFAALQEYGETLGLSSVRFETLAQTLLAAGEPDQFAEALEAAGEVARAQRRLQLKSLLFGMGETFRTLIQSAGGKHAAGLTK